MGELLQHGSTVVNTLIHYSTVFGTDVSIVVIAVIMYSIPYSIWHLIK